MRFSLVFNEEIIGNAVKIEENKIELKEMFIR